MRGTVVLALALSLLSLDAQAISRYNSLTMSCARVQAVLRNEGAAIISYGSNPRAPLYNRFVANAGFCGSTDIGRAAWVPTADNKACPILKCFEMSHSGR